ncbi:hypothetical protein ACHAXR_008780 [Thalassiosira sp. AJA248-18]
MAGHSIILLHLPTILPSLLLALLLNSSTCSAFHCSSAHHHDHAPITSSSLLFSQSSSSPPVSVYNNVLTDKACKYLHKLTLESTQRSRDGSFLFYRGSSNHNNPNHRLTPLETTIDQILTSLNDTSPIVEYWSRKQYINMDAHSDIDENTLKDEGVLRCPTKGHVLYMQIPNNNNATNYDDGTEKHSEEEQQQRMMGPTIVFPDRKIAWGSVSPRTLPSPSMASYNSKVNLKERSPEFIVDVENYWSDEERRQYGYDDDDNNSNEKEDERMAIVPAINGRLLRFDGAAFHSVPKPPDRYLLSDKELAAFLENEPGDFEDIDGYWDDDEYDDDDEDDDDEEEGGNSSVDKLRSVLLFNTWPEGSFGPKGVQTDTIVDEVPDGIVVEGDDDNSDNGGGGSSSMVDERWSKWQQTYGEEFELVWCNPFEEWISAVVDDKMDDDPSSIIEEDGSSASKKKKKKKRDVTIPLMGNPSRRGVPDSKALMEGTVANDQFYDSHTVSLVTLKKKGVRIK